MLLNGWISNNSFAITWELFSELLKLGHLIWNPSLATFPAACLVQINSEYLKYFKSFNLGYGWAIFVPRFHWYIKFWQCNWKWLRKATPQRVGVFSYPSLLQGQGNSKLRKKEEARGRWFVFFQGHNAVCSPLPDICTSGEIIADKACLQLERRAKAFDKVSTCKFFL